MDRLKEIEEQIQNAAPQQMEVWLAQLSHQAATARATYIDTKEIHSIQRDALEYYVHSQVQAVIEEREKKQSVTGATAKIKSSDDYFSRLKDLGAARAIMDRAKVEADNLERSWDTIRSILASRNAERRMA